MQQRKALKLYIMIMIILCIIHSVIGAHENTYLMHNAAEDSKLMSCEIKRKDKKRHHEENLSL